MPTIAEIRQQYPQYNDMTDTQLADGMYNKFYKDMPREEFNSKIGYDKSKQAADDLTAGFTGESGGAANFEGASAVPIQMAKGVPVLGAAVPSTKSSEEFEKENPKTAAAMRGIGGALATAPLITAAPGLFGLNATRGIVANTLTGAASGGALSAADAAARGEKVLPNAATGAIAGGVAPIVGKGIGAVINYLNPQVKGLLAGFNPKALDFASDLARKDGLTDPQIAKRLTELGPQGFLSEYSPRMSGAATGVASMSGGGPGKMGLIKGFEERAAPEAANQRITQGVDKMLGKPENLTQRIIDDIEERSNVAGPLFEQWKKTSIQPTNELKDIVKGLEEKGFLKEASELAEARALSGKPVPSMKNFFTTGERKDWPTAESYGYLRRAINNRIAGEGNPDLISAWRGVRDRLDKAIEGSDPVAAKVWKQARDEWGTRSEIMKARDAGLDAWSTKLTPDQLLENLTNMTTAERAAFKEGARAALAQKMESSARGDTNTRELLRSQYAKDKMHMLAENKATSAKDVDEFLNQMEREAGYGQSARDLKTTTQKEINKEVREALTPDPNKTTTGHLLERFYYSPHVTPIKLVPGLETIKGLAAKRQAAQAEKMRDSLGSLLSKQGTEAADMARALLNYNRQGQNQAGMNVAGIVRQLLQPSLPGTPVTSPF